MRGTVTKSLDIPKDQNKVFVHLNEDAIDYCKGCGGCSSLFKCKKTSSRVVIAKNPINACPGDRVELCLEDGATLKVMIYLLLLPLIIFMVIIFSGSYFGITPAIIFLICMSACTLFYCILKQAFKYKTYYVITSKSRNL